MKGWELKKQSDVLGLLLCPRLDQPWTFCSFEPTVGFQDVKSLFEREIKMLNTGLVTSEDMTEWEESVSAIDGLNLSLHSLDDASIISDFLLHIESEEAWFRY